MTREDKCKQNISQISKRKKTKTKKEKQESVKKKKKYKTIRQKLRLTIIYHLKVNV